MSSLIFCHFCGEVNLPESKTCVNCGKSLTSLLSTPTGMLSESTLLHDRYSIIARVGKGGMGAVYRAEDTLLGNRPVAIKEMSQQKLTSQQLLRAVDSFKQEAFILARLQHPGLPSIHDYFQAEGRWYLVMSFVPGESLKEYLERRGGTLPLHEVFYIGIELCFVLDYLHQQKPPIIFRDLKPSNIMRGPEGQIVLVDFGIARHFKEGQSRDTISLGSIGYAAPEQYGKEQTSPRSDIYSLGVLLHHLISGYNPSHTPFSIPSLYDLAITDVPLELDSLLMRMLETDPEERPACIDDVQLELQRISANVSDPLEDATLDLAEPYDLQTSANQDEALTEPSTEQTEQDLTPSDTPQEQVIQHASTAEIAVPMPQSTRRARMRVIQSIFLLIILLALAMDLWQYPVWFTFAVENFRFEVTLLNVLDMLILSLTLFTGIVFGPLPALLVGLGAILGDVVAIFHGTFAWNWDARAALLGLLINLLLLNARRRHQELSLAQLNAQNILALLLVTACASYLDMWLRGFSFATATSEFAGYAILSIIGCICFLSIILPIYERFFKKYLLPIHA